MPTPDKLVSDAHIAHEAYEYTCLEADPNSQEGMRCERHFIDAQKRLRTIYEADRSKKDELLGRLREAGQAMYDRFQDLRRTEEGSLEHFNAYAGMGDAQDAWTPLLNELDTIK